MSLNSLKIDFERMLGLSRELGRLHEMLSHHNNINDKRNYNEERCKEILKEIRRCDMEYCFLKNKWIN